MKILRLIYKSSFKWRCIDIKISKKEFESIFDKYKRDIYRLAYTYVNNEADALDIIQETAYQAYISRGKIRDKSKEKKFRKIISTVAASIIVILSTVNIIGLDKVEAAIKQALQYVPGYNLTIDTEDGKILALQESVLYEEDNIFVKITAASKLGEDLNISIQSNYNIMDASKREIDKSLNNMRISLIDENSNIVFSENWSRSGGGSEFWQGDYNFIVVDDDGKSYALLIDDLEIPFKLRETKEVDNFLELGPSAEDKGIRIVAIKKLVEDKIMISLLNQSEEWTVEDYSFKGTDDLGQFTRLGMEKSMYLLDLEGNKTFPIIPSSYGNLMSDFYFQTLEREGLKLVLPYLRVGYYNIQTEKTKLKVPQNGEAVNINKALELGKFELEIVSIKRQDDQILINLDIKDLKDEVLTDLRVDGVSGYSMHRYKDNMEIGINLKDVGRRFSISFSSPRSILKGNWEIDLD